MEDGREWMEKAVAQARLCEPEDQLKPRPKVGVVIVQEGKFLDEAHRGELADGDHAEFTVLEKKLKQKRKSAAGATVYATLEPCTTRNHPKLPCAQWLVEHRVARVVVGMLDPNANILGRGILQLRNAGIAVDFFAPDLMSELEAMNSDFIRSHRASFPPPITENFLSELSNRTLDAWYVNLNSIYWNRNFQRDSMAIFTHLVEVVGSLSVFVSKKHDDANADKYVAKALAWWFALCGKVGVRSVEEVLWGKYPLVCPYCQQENHQADDCAEKKREKGGPDWSQLDKIGEGNIGRRPKTIAHWQRMFGTIYAPQSTEDYPVIFAKLAEEMGELAEALRVFPAAPGYFLSEAADVFAWLMKLINLAESKAKIGKAERGNQLLKVFVDAYPGRCVDCNSAVCTCPPILPSTIGRIAHEVSTARSTYRDDGNFMTADLASAKFGPAR